MRIAMPALAVLLSSVLFTACSEKDPAPAELQLAELVRFAESYDGMRVAVTGTVRFFPDPRHYWIEDSELNRVEVQPQSAVSELVGRTVRITGKFQYSPDRGRSIQAGSTTVVEE